MNMADRKNVVSEQVHTKRIGCLAFGESLLVSASEDQYVSFFFLFFSLSFFIFLHLSSFFSLLNFKLVHYSKIGLWEFIYDEKGLKLQSRPDIIEFYGNVPLEIHFPPNDQNLLLFVQQDCLCILSFPFLSFVCDLTDIAIYQLKFGAPNYKKKIARFVDDSKTIVSACYSVCLFLLFIITFYFTFIFLSLFFVVVFI